MGTALQVLGFAWDNRKGLLRAYHHFIKHKIILDDLIDMAEESPSHPNNRKKREDQARLIESYDAGG